MLTLYITRHGETEWNTQKKMQGWQDSPLTENGIENALCLRDRMNPIPLDIIYASPSGRTRKTANLIRGNRSIPILLNDNLKEINMGTWEGKTLLAIQEEEPAAFYAFWNAPNDYVSNGGESFYETVERVREVLKQIEHKYPSGNVLIVTHSVVIKCLFTIFNNNGIENLWDPPFIEDTSLTIVEKSDEGYQLILEGCTVHKNLAMKE
ncbi:histidine phosphatase family protein [Planomicrobium sp. CPCC 101079]|uniref:histidine phosphatase family protein n=1 Tax=Planomicrobium sp. CPCC 101079 TaxID=2599618 RepID=UPI0011B7256D|nr:histidine phosphatase family protein [Planomicrobium sp. CPCC 101079]TWT00138.1 histidine phosphatase family protein [Planomicrobium sp. CPCC 101079]